MVYRGAGVNSFLYTEEAIEEIETSLSRERLSTYLDAAGDDRERAIRFHAWNTAVSAAFYGPLQGLEVALRNAMHRPLAERYGPAWYDNPDTGLDTWIDIDVDSPTWPCNSMVAMVCSVIG